MQKEKERDKRASKYVRMGGNNSEIRESCTLRTEVKNVASTSVCSTYAACRSILSQSYTITYANPFYWLHDCLIIRTSP